MLILVIENAAFPYHPKCDSEEVFENGECYYVIRDNDININNDGNDILEFRSAFSNNNASQKCGPNKQFILGKCRKTLKCLSPRRFLRAKCEYVFSNR